MLSVFRDFLLVIRLFYKQTQSYILHCNLKAYFEKGYMALLLKFLDGSPDNKSRSVKHNFVTGWFLSHSLHVNFLNSFIKFIYF